MKKSEICIVIVDDEPIIRMDLKEILESKGYQVVGEAADGFDAVELCRTHVPDLVLLDIKMPLMDGLSAAQIIHEQGLAGAIVLLTAYSESSYIEGAKESGVSGYLVKPVDEKALVPCIELAMARSSEMKALKTDVEKANERLETRKVVEKAKGYLMETNHVSEEEAYEYIRKMSKLKNVSMKRIAEILLMKCGR